MRIKGLFICFGALWGQVMILVPLAYYDNDALYWTVVVLTAFVVGSIWAEVYRMVKGA